MPFKRTFFKIKKKNFFDFFFVRRNRLIVTIYFFVLDMSLWLTVFFFFKNFILYQLFYFGLAFLFVQNSTNFVSNKITISITFQFCNLFLFKNSCFIIKYTVSIITSAFSIKTYIVQKIE